VEEFKAQLKELKVKLKAAEKRAIIAEKTVKIFTKEMDKREGNNRVMCAFLIDFKFSNLSKRSQLLLTNCRSCFRLSAERKGKIQIYLRRLGLHVFGAYGILNRQIDCSIILPIRRFASHKNSLNINSHIYRISYEVRPKKSILCYFTRYQFI